MHYKYIYTIIAKFLFFGAWHDPKVLSICCIRERRENRIKTKGWHEKYPEIGNVYFTKSECTTQINPSEPSLSNPHSSVRVKIKFSGRTPLFAYLGVNFCR